MVPNNTIQSNSSSPSSSNLQLVSSTADKTKTAKSPIEDALPKEILVMVFDCLTPYECARAIVSRSFCQIFKDSVAYRYTVIYQMILPKEIDYRLSIPQLAIVLKNPTLGEDTIQKLAALAVKLDTRTMNYFGKQSLVDCGHVKVATSASKEMDTKQEHEELFYAVTTTAIHIWDGKGLKEGLQEKDIIKTHSVFNDFQSSKSYVITEVIRSDNLLYLNCSRYTSDVDKITKVFNLNNVSAAPKEFDGSVDSSALQNGFVHLSSSGSNTSVDVYKSDTMIGRYSIDTLSIEGAWKTNLSIAKRLRDGNIEIKVIDVGFGFEVAVSGNAKFRQLDESFITVLSQNFLKANLVSLKLMKCVHLTFEDQSNLSVYILDAPRPKPTRAHDFWNP